MNILVIQPPYPEEAVVTEAQACLEWIVLSLDKLKPGSQDLIVLPEYANAPGLDDIQAIAAFTEIQGEQFLEHIKKSAKRLNCLIAIGTVGRMNSCWVNRTLLIDSKGTEIFSYDKVHLTDTETNDLKLISGSKIEVFQYENIRIGFAVCFDMYFSEHFATLAEQRPDIIICPSYQRSETSERILSISQIRAMDSGAYLIRSSYAMKHTCTGGHSLVASPDGSILSHAEFNPALINVEIDLKQKFVKPRSHGQPLINYIDLIEDHRHPYLYRPYSKRREAITESPFPHICAHRGLSSVCPENTLPAFAAALALGVHEIEFDLWMSKDGVPVVCHDQSVERTTNGKGVINELMWDEICEFDAGISFGSAWSGIKMPCFDAVARLVDGRAVMNIHMKDSGPEGMLIYKVCDILRETGNITSAYLSCGREETLQFAIDYAPDIARACLIDQNNPFSMMKKAEEFGCSRVQFYRSVTQDAIDKAHEAGLICNLFWSDEPEDAKRYFKQGIDVILTNYSHLLFANGFHSLNDAQKTL